MAKLQGHSLLGGKAMDELIEGEIGEEPQEEVVVQGRQGWLSNAPWWMVSVGIHAVLVLGATLVAIEHLEAVEKGPTEITITRAASSIIQDPEKPRDVFNRRGLPIDDPTPS